MTQRSRRSKRSIVAGGLALASLLAVAAPAGAFEARGSVEQVYANGIEARAKVALVDRAGDAVNHARANRAGAVLFRGVEPGGGYRVEVAKAGRSDKLKVLSGKPTPPDDSVYNQTLPTGGYGYLETRDGTKLAINVHPAEDVLNAFGVEIPDIGAPRPTLVEYSGYGYADPAGPESGISLLANLMGFNVVDVNMRGTGCSGGAFDFFERLQSLDSTASRGERAGA